jgi:hypothetical protein
MRAVIVYESLFGNTREIAEAIREGVASADPDAHVLCVRVADATADVVREADLLVAGGPTHMRRMTSRLTRTKGLQSEEKTAANFHPEPGAAGLGLREWFDDVPPARPRAVAAAFDTRVGARLAGGAARGIAARLKRHGYRLAVPPCGFVVEGTEGPLRAGELDRAAVWGASLCQFVPAPTH